MTVETSSVRELGKVTTAGFFITGAVTSFLNITTFHPLFTIKTLVMTRLPINPKGLYAGYGANLTCDIANQAVAFCGFGFFKNQVVALTGRPLSPTENFVGGLFAGTVAAPLLTGLERIMIIQQVYRNSMGLKAKPISAKEVVRQIYEKEGVRGAMKGMIPTIFRESINSSCFFGLSKAFNHLIENSVGPSTFGTTLSYLLAGATAGFLTTPLDYIKTRIQKDIKDEVRTMADEIKTITDGKITNIPRLYRGAIPRVVMLGSTMMGMGFYSEKAEARLPSIFRENVRSAELK